MTLLREAKSVEVIEFIERLGAQLRLIFSKKTGSYSAIFSKGLSTLKPEDLIKITEETLVVLRNNTERVAIYGVTNEKIADLETLINEFSVLHINQKGRTQSLSNFTEDRIDLRTDVYNLLQYISGVGRAYWKRNKKSRYDDYVLQKLKAKPVAKATETTEEVEHVSTNF